MEVNHLRYFYEVAKHRSFTKASKKLLVSQPSISRMVKTLEENLGVQLLHRDKRKVSLTEPGRHFFERCDLIFKETQGLREYVKDYNKECSGYLRVGASDNICNYLLPNKIQDFSQKFSRVKVELFSGTSTAIKKQLIEEDIELGLFYTSLSESERAKLECERVQFVEFVVASPIKMKIQNLSYVGSRTQDYDGCSPAEKMLKSLNLNPKKYIESNNQETQKRMVLAGAGFSVMPYHMLVEEAQSGKVGILRAEKKMGTDLLLVKRRGRILSKAGKEFVDMIKSGFSLDK